MESTLAGMGEHLVLGGERRGGHLRDHEARVEPAVAGQEGGQAGERGVHELLDAPLADGAELGHRDGQHVGGQGDRLAVEVAAREQLAASRRRPSGCRWRRSSRSSTRARRRRRARRARRRAPAACSAGSRRPAPCRSRGATRGCALPASRRAQVARARRACPGCGRAAWMRGSKATSVPLSASSGERAGDVGGAREPPGLGAARGPPTAVMSCVPLMRARPSFASSTTGARPGRAQRLGRAHAAARRRRQSPSPMSASARCASGARSPQAPTEPCDGHDRDGRRALSIASSSSSVCGRTPLIALGQHVRAQQHERARLRLVQRLADAGGVAAHQVELQLAQALAAGSRRRRSCRSRC